MRRSSVKNLLQTAGSARRKDAARHGKVRALEQGVEGDIDAEALPVGKVNHGLKLRGAEIVRPGAGGKAFQSKIDGVGAGGGCGEEGGGVARGGENLWLGHGV